MTSWAYSTVTCSINNTDVLRYALPASEMKADYHRCDLVIPTELKMSFGSDTYSTLEKSCFSNSCGKIWGGGEGELGLCFSLRGTHQGLTHSDTQRWIAEAARYSVMASLKELSVGISHSNGDSWKMKSTGSSAFIMVCKYSQSFN